MRLRVYGETDDTLTQLRLVQIDEDAIELWIVDNHGRMVERGRVCRITPDGLGRMQGLHGAFPTDGMNRIRLDD